VKNTLDPKLRCRACHTDPITVEVDIWEGEFHSYCEPCGQAMVGIIQEARKRTPTIRSLGPIPSVIAPNPPPPPPPAPKKVEIPKGILKKMEPERLLEAINLTDLLGM